MDGRDELEGEVKEVKRPRYRTKKIEDEVGSK